MERENERKRDFDSLRGKLRCLYCEADEQNYLCDDDFFDIQEEISGIPWIDGCKLYRYSSCDDWNICNLCKQQLRLSPVGEMNDLFEGITPSETEGISKKNWKDLEKTMYLKCFSENWDNLLMWAHYADGCRGMCVEYDLSVLDTDHSVFWYLYPVHYSSQRYKKGGLKNMDAEIEEYRKSLNSGTPLKSSMWLKDIMAFYLIKSEEWAYEKEWRIAFPERYLGETMNGISADGIISMPCITAVYLGYRMPEEKKQIIREIVQKINARQDCSIKIKEIVMDENTYQLNVK